MRECEAMETEIAMLKNKRSPSEVRLASTRRRDEHGPLIMRVYL